jgi:RND family efflux transporter MFP subunit
VKTETVLPEEKIKAVEVVEFGTWSPDAQREITGTILSGTDVDIQAEISGTIEKTPVSIGDMVTEGQVLAIFQRQDDVTQISYENLLQQLAVAKIQTAASIQSAETALLSTQRQQGQTESTEAQNYSRTFDLLQTSARNAETTFRNTIEWADQLLGVSTGARGDVNYVSQQIGQNNSILKQNVKNKIEEILLERARLEREILPQTLSDAEVLKLSKDRLALLRKTQEIVRNIDTLLLGTPVTSSFDALDKSSYRGETDGYLSQIEAAVYSLENQIEAAKSEQGRNKLSVLGVDNAVQQAESSLELAKAQARSQITQLETQLRLAQNTQKELTVRAPFSGKITGKTVLAFDQVKAGSVLFSMVGTDIDPRVSTTMTLDELVRVQANQDTVQALFEDGTKVGLKTFQISGKLDSTTQKLTVEFPLSELPKGALIGSFVKVLLPIDGTNTNLLPISALSFEPDGAEVLIVKDGQGQRVKVALGKLVSNAVEINGGLEAGTQVVRYRTRAHAGEKLEIIVE